MKNKKLFYSLLVVVLAVWGLIVFRIMERGDSASKKLSVRKEGILFAEPEPFEVPDSATAVVDYRDPFLGVIISRADIAYAEPTVSAPARPPAPRPSPVDWKSIVYTGYIMNPGKRKPVSIMVINGKEEMLMDGDVRSGVKLIKSYRDSVKVEFKTETKFILLN